MRPVLLVPGINGSGPHHWQTAWERQHAGVRRVAQHDWDHPDCDDWAAALERAVAALEAPPVIVAHSLGNLVAARWASRSPRPVQALLLVAVPDPTGAAFPHQARGFVPVAAGLGGHRAVVVSSCDDPYSSPGFTRRCVAAWGAEHVELGARGHLNADSGLGAWAEGWSIVERLR